MTKPKLILLIFLSLAMALSPIVVFAANRSNTFYHYRVGHFPAPFLNQNSLSVSGNSVTISWTVRTNSDGAGYSILMRGKNQRPLPPSMYPPICPDDCPWFPDPNNRVVFAGTERSYSEVFSGSAGDTFYYAVFWIDDSSYNADPQHGYKYYSQSDVATVTKGGNSLTASCCLPSEPTSNLSRTGGVVVRYPNDGTFYVIDDIKKRPIPDYDIYTSYFPGHPVISIPRAEQYQAGGNWNYPAGTLLRVQGQAAVYVILDDDTKYIFKNEEEFLRFGYRWENIHSVSSTYINQIPSSKISSLTYHPNRTFVKYAGNDTVYMIENGLKRPIPSMDVLGTYINTAVSPREIYEIPSTFNYSNGPDLGFADGSLIKGLGSTVYIVYKGYRKPFSSAQDFLDLGYKFEMVKDVMQSDLEKNLLGANVE